MNGDIQPSVIEQIKEIWTLCFGDERETVDYFFKTCFSSENCYVKIIDNKAVASLQMIPCKIIDKEKVYEAKYIYAVCTHPSYQGRGIMSELINEAFEEEKLKGTKAVLCIPASESLFSYYKRFGFEDKIYNSREIFKRKDIEKIYSECSYFLNKSVTEIKQLRDELLISSSYVSFPEAYLNLCSEFGYNYCYNSNFYALFSVEENTVNAVDCFWKNEQGKKEMLYSLLNETDADKFIIEYFGKDKLKGVIKYLNPDFKINSPIYLGIEME